MPRSGHTSIQADQHFVHLSLSLSLSLSPYLSLSPSYFNATHTTIHPKVLLVVDGGKNERE